MAESKSYRQRAARYVQLLARAIGTLTFLFFGTFFVEHLSWFKDVSNLPPTRVIIMQAAHLLFLVGYLAAFKWETVGGALIVVGTGVFFGMMGERDIVWLFVIAVSPGLLYLITAWLRREKSSPAP